MGGVPTRLVNDFLFYGFLLGAGVLFILGSSLYIPALRPASGSSNNSGLQSIQDQLNRLSSQISSKSSGGGIPINWVVPSASAPSKSTYKAPTSVKQTNSNSNCSNAGGYTIWRGSGCNGGRSQSGLEYAILGTNKCSEARAAFLKRWACK